jgi:hypothetical protein
VQQYSKVAPKVNEFVGQAKPFVKRGVDEVGKVTSPLVSKFNTEAVPTITVRRRARDGAGAQTARLSSLERGL